MKVKLFDECNKRLDDVSVEIIEAPGSVPEVADVEDELENIDGVFVTKVIELADVSALIVDLEESVELILVERS